MAVPCEGAKIIFEAILKSFAGIEYDSVECNAMEYMFNSEEDSKWQFDADLEKKVLIDPAKEGANELRIVSAYASPSMVAWHIQALADLNIQPVQIKLIVGMCPFDGLSMVTNSGFKKLAEAEFGPEYSSFNCQYVYKSPAVHSKLYLWMKNGKPFKAFSGSANYQRCIGMDEVIVSRQLRGKYGLFERMDDAKESKQRFEQFMKKLTI